MIGLNPSTYYRKPKVRREDRERNDASLRDSIEAIQSEYPQAGYRTIHQQLRRIGQRINSKRVRRVMAKFSLHAKACKAFVATTDSNHSYPIYENLIAGKTVTGIDQVWVADITYIRILTGFVYLAVVLDIYSRRVIGWAISKSIDHTLTVAALEMAIRLRNPLAGVIHHSDRGVQYACEQYIALLQAHGILVSMSRPGNPYDNAFAESFMKTLKREEVHLWEYESFLDVIQSVPRFIEKVYNKKRVHSGINYLPPEEFETILKETPDNKLSQIALHIAPLNRSTR